MSFSNKMLAGKRILITGAARGIGRSCAMSCAEQGAQVIAVDLSEGELSTLVNESKGDIKPWVADVASDELAERIRGLDRMDGLINNAGTNRVGPMETQSQENIDLILNLNTCSLSHLTGGDSSHETFWKWLNRLYVVADGACWFAQQNVVLHEQICRRRLK